MKAIRREHPHLKLIVVENGLASNEPHLQLLEALSMHYLIGVKPGDHPYLFDWVKRSPCKYYRQVNACGTVHDYQ